MFQIGFLFPKNSVYKNKLNSLILLAQQAGLIDKIENEVKWSMQRSITGKLLQASSSSPLRESIQEERQLTTADTEGMFLLMGVGYTIGAIALVSEIVGGITNKCRQIMKRTRLSISSNWSSQHNSGDLLKPRKPLDKHEQLAYAAREVARKVAQKESHKTENLVGFGRKQFNLTRTTLRELYGDYHKTQPDYVLKDGRVTVEDSMESDGSIEPFTRESSASTKSSLSLKNCDEIAPELNDNEVKEFVDRFLSEEIEKTLNSFDETLLQYHTEVPQEYSKIEEEVFGSFITTKQENCGPLNNLKLFKDEHDLIIINEHSLQNEETLRKSIDSNINEEPDEKAD